MNPSDGIRNGTEGCSQRVVAGAGSGRGRIRARLWRTGSGGWAGFANSRRRSTVARTERLTGQYSLGYKSYIPAHRGASSGDVLKAERGAAPAAAARNRGTGRPRVAVRPYYGGLPLMAGRGADEGRRKPPEFGLARKPRRVRARKLRPRGRKSPRRHASLGVSGGFAGRPRARSQALCVSRRSAPLNGGVG